MRSKYFLSLAVLFAFHQTLPAQSCLQDGIVFSRQSQLDSFHLQFPNCFSIEGSVEITGAEIQNLDSLFHLQSIGGSLKISNTELLKNCLGLHKSL